MRGLDPRIPLRKARCLTKRDGRDNGVPADKVGGDPVPAMTTN
jgi:hypothetical protein